MPDFTLSTFRLLLTALKGQNYTFQTFAQFLKEPATRAIILRHDVDARKLNSLKTAKFEDGLGIAGIYNFRIVPGSFDVEVIKQIADLGHEIGYHYEDLSWAGKNFTGRSEGEMGRKGEGERGGKGETGRERGEELLYKRAIESFEKNLQLLRKIAPVDTICMHGSPLSRYDNRKLWERYDYRDFGIAGEPYFDVNFDVVLYLTDTGRRWDGDSVNVRDRSINRKDSKVDTMAAKDEILPSPTPSRSLLASCKCHSTFDIIDSAKRNQLPDQIMITIHPQRWNDKPFPWLWELIWQNIKNVGKRIVVPIRNTD